MTRHVLVAFDFDHTLIDDNCDTYILRLLPDGSQLPASITTLYSTVTGWNDYQRQVFEYLYRNHVTKEQLLTCVAELSLVTGMRELLEYLATTSTSDAVDDSRSTVPTSVAGPCSVADGKPRQSSSSVRFDVIVVSDANSVRLCAFCFVFVSAILVDRFVLPFTVGWL